ncbi:nitrilase-related carbon-nitrogen hydrolase [Kitasatospora sp. NPDC092948]|uniref:nitrilase-related carbon-nitrogen hydrolase n=1 Tax=Kitasatospora sp. NPDC092948 TaxID=3364088 RepID=UPI0037F2048D
MTSDMASDMASDAASNSRETSRRSWWRSRPSLLLAGTAAMLFAVGGRWDVAASAWVFPVFLLAFSRRSGVWSGAGWVWGAHGAAAVFWVWESAIGFNPVVVGGAVGLAALQTAPFLVDRLLSGRLRPWQGALVFPAGLAAAEFLITVLSPFGTAFGSLAVTQYDNLPLLQVVSVTGPYGVGFLIGWFAATVLRIRRWPSWRSGAVCGSVLVAVLLAGGARLASGPDGGPTVRVAGVSPSRAVVNAEEAALEQLSAENVQFRAAPGAEAGAITDAVEADLLASTRREAAAGAKIVVWPEEAVRTQEAQAGAVIAAAQEGARQSGVYLEVGLRVDSAAGPAQDRDEALLIDPSGTVLWTYRKAHPIPGSESYAPGDGRVPVADTPYGRIADVICYDADFPALMQVRADLMLVPSHDWREYGSAHTKKAALRAVENGYSLIRQDSAGVSTAFDSRGRVLATADWFGTDQQTVVAQLPTHRTATVYNRIGDTFARLCLAAVAALAVTALIRRHIGEER